MIDINAIKWEWERINGNFHPQWNIIENDLHIIVDEKQTHELRTNKFNNLPKSVHKIIQYLNKYNL